MSTVFQMKNILFITTSASKLGNSDTGVWLEELTTPYYILKEAGFEVDIISPKGGKVPYDPTALEKENIKPSVKKFLADNPAFSKLENSKTIAETDFSKYDAIFFPGGHGAVVDLPFDEVLAEKLGEFFDSGKLVSAICHGPGGLVSAKRKDGRSIVYGLKLTSFSNNEEDSVGATAKVPFLLESRLQELGGVYSSAGNFEEYVVTDRNLITGQNPASSEKIAVEMVGYLSK